MTAITSKRLGLGALVIGVVLILMAVSELVSDWLFFRNAVTVEATVWFTSTGPDNGGRGVRVRVPVDDGETEVMVLPYHVSKAAGSAVTIAWPEGRPAEARINSPGERAVVPVLYLLIAIPLLWTSRWLRDDSMPEWAREEYRQASHSTEHRESRQYQKENTNGEVKTKTSIHSTERARSESVIRQGFDDSFSADAGDKE